MKKFLMLVTLVALPGAVLAAGKKGKEPANPGSSNATPSPLEAARTKAAGTQEALTKAQATHTADSNAANAKALADAQTAHRDATAELSDAQYNAQWSEAYFVTKPYHYAWHHPKTSLGVAAAVLAASIVYYYNPLASSEEDDEVEEA